MSKAVVILGAGASADFGIPTLKGLFQNGQVRQYLRQHPTLHSRLCEIFWNRRGHNLDSSDRSLTIEEMLTLLRDWEKDPGPNRPDVSFAEDFRKSLYIVIKKAVFDGRNTRPEHLNPVIDICNAKYERVTWASFNWDCIFDASFWYWQPYQGPRSRSNPRLVIQMENWFGEWHKHEFLKLHGSINWWMINNRLTYLPFSSTGGLTAKWQEYEATPDCRDRPVILEPSAYKYHDPLYTILEPQWSHFFQRLCEADSIIIIGYSLPEADVQARLKLMTAFQMNPSCKWLVIDSSEQTITRYKRLLGDTCLTAKEMGLVAFNADIRRHMQEAFPNIDFSEPPPPAPPPTAEVST